MTLLSTIERGEDYLEPGVIVFGIGMTVFVAPLTTAVLGALPDDRAGIASAVNNAASRVGQLIAWTALCVHLVQTVRGSGRRLPGWRRRPPLTIPPRGNRIDA